MITPIKDTPDFESISSLYDFDFFDPPFSENVENFFEIRDLVLEIEKCVQGKKEQKLDLGILRERIKNNIECAEPHQVKMGELGMILFYLDHPERPFPTNERSLVDFRAQEIAEEVSSLIHHHEQVCKDKRIPSGKTHYLLRAFSHMAITSTQAYNKGGLYALLTILESAKYQVSLHLRAEHHEHIVIVTRQILSNPAFVGLFQRTVNVYPQLQDAIRIDLKLNPKQPIQSTHVFLDCFMFVFSDIRQINRPNCYAIGALIYSIENAPYKTMETMIKWLEQGHFTFNGSMSIPILPLLEKRLIQARDLQLKLETDKALVLTTFNHISSTLKIESEETSSSDEIAPLQTTLNTILDASASNAHLPYAEKLYYAYKYITLSHLALGIMEFSYLNCPESTSSSTSYSLHKEGFVQSVISRIADECPKQHMRDLLVLIEQKLGERFWFENCYESDVSINGKTVYAGNKVVQNFNGDLESLAEILENSMRLFYFKSGNYLLVETLTDLHEAICAVIDESVKELKEKSGVVLEHSAQTLKETIRKSEPFSHLVTTFAANHMRQRGITASHLHEANLLIFDQLGGIPNEVLQNIFSLDVVIKEISGAITPYEFVKKLTSAARTLDTGLFRSTPRILAFTHGRHIWTLSPNRLRMIFDAPSFSTLVQNAIFDPANAFFKRLIPVEIRDAVIQRYAETEAIEDQMHAYFEKIQFLTYGRFRKELLERSHSYRLIKEIIDEEFGKVCLATFDLPKVAEELRLVIPKSVRISIYQELSYASGTMAPYQLASLIRKLFIQHEVSIVDPYDLECAICKAHNLPIAFDIGDLNWDEGEYREDPPHPHLVIRYNWAERTLSYYTRMRTAEYLRQNREFEQFEIQHPLIQPSKNTFW